MKTPPSSFESRASRRTWFTFGAACLLLLALGAVSAQERRDELRVVIVPPVALLHLGSNGRLPDMKFITAREEAAARLGALLAARHTIGRYDVVPESGVTALLTDLGWSAPDLFRPGPTSDDASPAETLRGRKDESIALWEPLDTLKTDRTGWAVYRHSRSNGSSGGSKPAFGIATVGETPDIVPDPDKAKRLAEALDADLLVFIQLDEMKGSVQDRVRTASGDFQSSFNPLWPVETTSGYPWRQLARLSRYMVLTERMPYRIQIVSGTDGKLVDHRPTFGDSVRPILFEGEDSVTVRHREPDEIVARAQAEALPRILQTLLTGPGQARPRVH